MSYRTVPLKLVPPGLLVDRHEIGIDGIVVHAHGAAVTSDCPACGLSSSSVHSRYGRTLGDFPAHGRRLRIRLAAQRFRCRNASCERRIFTERFPPDLIQAHARRTSRLDVLTHAIALALGGRPGERLAGRLSMPVSADTLLRLLRRRVALSRSNVRVVGIDDFAWRKGQRYGRSSATSSVAAPSISCRTGRVAASRIGSLPIPASRPSAATAAVGTARAPPRALLRLYRSPTGGICWRTPPPPSSRG